MVERMVGSKYKAFIANEDIVQNSEDLKLWIDGCLKYQYISTVCDSLKEREDGDPEIHCQTRSLRKNSLEELLLSKNFH